MGRSAMRVAISGAGIAGLAAAIALGRAGHEVRVFEQAPRIEEVGAGLQLGPNAVSALIRLGAWDAVAPMAVAPAAIEIRDALAGRRLARLPLGADFERRFGAPYRVAHRADLIAGLFAAAQATPGVEIVTGTRVAGLDETGPAPALVTADTRIAADLVIGADGLRSTVRRAVVGDGEPRLSSHVIYRGMSTVNRTPPELDPAAVHLWLAPGGHVVHYPVSAGKRLNIVAVIEDALDTPGWNLPAARPELDGRFVEAAAPLREVLDTPAAWLKWAGADRDPAAAWGRGAVTLAGDAAHPTLPYLAQGAAMGLEDAIALARHLDAGPDLGGALRAYEAERRPRTARLTLESRRTGTVYHAAGLVRAARNAALAALPPAAVFARLDWIYRWHA